MSKLYKGTLPSTENTPLVFLDSDLARHCHKLRHFQSQIATTSQMATITNCYVTPYIWNSGHIDMMLCTADTIYVTLASKMRGAFCEIRVNPMLYLVTVMT